MRAPDGPIIVKGDVLLAVENVSLRFGGLKALSLDSLTFLARLYWYTVEFGLIRTPEGLRIYGSGIVSSKGESIYALESNKPRRLPFDLMRIMQTDYRIDDFQDIYFVIDSYEQLFAATRPDFTPYYAALKTLPTIPPGDVLPNEREILRQVSESESGEPA